MRPEHWAGVAQHARVQHGLVTAAQVRAAGASARTLARAVSRGVLLPVRRSVFAVAGAPASAWQVLMAAYLAADGAAVVSHRAAAALHGLPGVLPGCVDLLCLGRPLQLHGVRCHRTTVPFADDAVTVQGFRTTSPARTLVDVAAEVHPSLVAKIAEAAFRRRLCSPPDLERELARTGRQGRAGTRAVRAALVDHVGGDSDLEASWLRRLSLAGLRPPALQHHLVVRGRVLIVDFAWPDRRVGVEVDGWAVHGQRSVWDNDHAKANAYVEAGWRVLFVTSRTPRLDVIAQLRQVPVVIACQVLAPNHAHRREEAANAMTTRPRRTR